ncbi:hypothetical protein P692DRAFT_201801296 [Suillus brevipes Sb2]|nr:hypothetical protein P692DRAFT_201801296 [Suillus brevipes Sb2]
MTEYYTEFTLRRDRLNVRPAYTRSDSYQNEVFEDSHHYTRTTPDSIYQTALERAYLLCLAAVQLPRNVLNHLSHVYLSVVKALRGRWDRDEKVMMFIVVSMASPSITDGLGDDDSDERVFFWGKVVLTLFKGRTICSNENLTLAPSDELRDPHPSNTANPLQISAMLGISLACTTTVPRMVYTLDIKIVQTGRESKRINIFREMKAHTKPIHQLGMTQTVNNANN